MCCCITRSYSYLTDMILSSGVNLASYSKALIDSSATIGPWLKEEGRGPHSGRSKYAIQWRIITHTHTHSNRCTHASYASELALGIM